MTTDMIYNVLFLCTGNSARSIMAEALMNRAGKGKFHAYSAGSRPTGTVNPLAINLLQKTEHPTDGMRSKGWEEFTPAINPDAPRLDFVFTVCDDAAGETCPVWPGQPMTAHWGVPDPAAAQGTEAEKALAFAEAFRLLRNRIEIFVNLPIAAIDKMSLQTRLNEIGKLTSAPVPTAS